MAELATIARPYAEALFRAGTADLAAVEGWLDKAATVARDPQLQAFAANPNATNDQVYGLLTGVMGGDPLPSQGANFLRTVIENGRLSVLPEIAEQFRALKNSQGGSADGSSTPRLRWPAGIWTRCARHWSAALGASSSSPSA